MSLSNNRIKKIRCSPDCPKLKTLFLQLNDLERISSGFFKLMPSLVVLDLSTNVSLRELPEEISRLVSLQYLNLSYTNIEELPLGLKELRKLLQLSLESAGMLKSISGVSSLLNLHCSLELDMELVEELKLLKHLKVLTVSGGDANVWEHFMSIPRLASCTRNVVLTHCEARAAGISIGPTSSRLQGLTIYESNIREFKIDQIDQKCDDDDDDESNKISPKALSNTTCNFRYLVNVEINECKGLRDLTWLIFAPNLVTLEVRDSPHIEEIVSKDKAGSFFMNGEEEAYEISMPFMKLKHLELENLEDLDSIYWSPLSFPCLVKIDVFGCPNLRKLPLSSSSASGCELIIYGEEDWLEELQWEEEDTKDNFTLKNIKVAAVTGSSSFNPQSQSELELRKRVADLEEEKRSKGCAKTRASSFRASCWIPASTSKCDSPVPKNPSTDAINTAGFKRKCEWR
uniref:Disease resistance protein RPS5 n=1 Tax=Noccaea caerulescens TaxID=107243 RepID=A0A1J3EJ88_NOCCA